MTAARLLVWDDEACWRVHEATLALLEETGVEVFHDAGRDILAAAGARVDGTRVRIGTELVSEALAGAARRCEIKARPAGAAGGSSATCGEVPRNGDGPDATPELGLELLDGRSYFGTGSDCIYFRDPETGERRRATMADVEGMAALCDRLPGIDFVMSMGIPADVPAEVDDLAQFAAMLAGTRKPLLTTAHDADSLLRMRELAGACGEPASFGLYAMPSPPLQHSEEAVAKLIVCAREEIPVVYAPAPASGTTAPASIGATVLIGNAEVLSGLVLHQLVNPGAPFVLGVGCGAFDMRTAVDVYGAPEHFLGNAAACDLCHFYGLPSFAYAAVSDAKVLDEQWAAEAAISAVLGALSRATLLHDVGYLESGLQSSYETIVLGHELVSYARALMNEVGSDSAALALNEIAAVGPGGSFLGRSHTRRHHREFWAPALFERGVFDRWQAEGGTTLKERVHERVGALRAQPRSFEPNDDARRALATALGHGAGRTGA
jgi:trimethylamine---corrinoid protein Co-methyltransferase